MKVFVYGTFKKGRFFHDDYVGERGVYVGNARTSHDYTMYVDALPYLVKEPSDNSVTGELYDVDAETVRKMDGLEGTERRQVIEVMMDDNSIVRAWAYVFPNTFKNKAGIMKEYEWS